MITKFLCGRRGWLALLVSLLAVGNAWAVTWTYYPDIAPYATYEVPFDSTFLAYKEEILTFNSQNYDRDKRVDDSCPPVVQLYPASFLDFETHWAISGEASFSATSSIKSKDLSGLYSGNVYVYVDDTFANGDTITVTMVLDDDGTHSPVTDNDGDTARSRTWTITWKTHCPTSLTCYTPWHPWVSCTAEQDNPAYYGYLMQPDIPPTGRPDYDGVSVQEAFGDRTSNIDKDVHVTAAGRAAHPTWTNEQWRDYFFGTSSTNSTFTPDEYDMFWDSHGGMFVYVEYLVIPPPTDLYVDLPQTYTCQSDNGTLNESHTIRRIRKAGTDDLRVQKW